MSRRIGKPWMEFAGNKIWVSEFTSIFFVCVLFAALASVSLVIIRNELAISEQNRRVAELKTEYLSAAKRIEEMKERRRLIQLLDIAVGKRMKGETLRRVADLIHKNSRQYGYSPELLLAVIAVESRFDPAALGRYRSGGLSGALGLMQIKYPTALEVANQLGIENLSPRDLFDPEINIVIGTAYLTTLITRFKSFQLGIIAYNLGPGTVRGTLSRREALPMRYYKKVLTQYYKLKELGDEL